MVTKKDRKMKEVESNFFRFENVGDSIEGTLIEKSTMKFNEDNIVGRYKIETDEGEVSTFLGSTTIDDLLEPIPEGTYIALERLEDVKSNQGRKVKKFKFMVEEA